MRKKPSKAAQQLQAVTHSAAPSWQIAPAGPSLTARITWPV